MVRSTNTATPPRERWWLLIAVILGSLGTLQPAGATTAPPTGTPVPCVAALAPEGSAQCCQFCPTTNTCVPAAGGSGCIQVSAPPECCWQAINVGGRIGVTEGRSGCGDGEVCYDVPPYFGELGELHTLRIGQLEFSVGQPRGGTPTNTATQTPSNTTPAPPTYTPVPTTSGGVCPGDCNGDGRVTINELVLGVGVVLGRVSNDVCPNFTWCPPGQVCIAILVDVVGNALSGCP